MGSLVRYFSCDDYARSFIEDGAVLFRALSFFRDYEDAGVRADPYEGTLAHRPNEGLKVQLVQKQQTLVLPHTFQARAREDDIYVYCLSTELSPYISNRFQAKVAVVIRDRGTFIARVRRALFLSEQVRAEQLVHGTVRYTNVHDVPGVDWALPERIALRKPKAFQWQKEYRIAVPVGEAFAVENVQVSLVQPASPRPAKREKHPQLMLHLGELSKICRLERL